MKNRVRELRKARKMTQPQLAKQLGVSLATIQNWEAEKTDMTGYSLAMLCDFFDVSPSEVYGTGEKSPEWEMRSELFMIFNEASREGKLAILAAARGIRDGYHIETIDTVTESKISY